MKGQIQQKEIEKAYCPTDSMCSDMLIRCLQSFKFKIIQAQVMNCPIYFHDISSDHNGTIMDCSTCPPLQGCNGINCITENQKTHQTSHAQGQKKNPENKVKPQHWKSPIDNHGDTPKI